MWHDRKRVSLPRGLADALLERAAASPEVEICGLIGGREAGLIHDYPVTNVAEDPSTRFDMDPRGQLDAMRRMRARGEEIVAIYHSHPRGPAWPSSTDLELAAYPDALYLIIAPSLQPPSRLRGFAIRNGGVRELTLDIG